VVLSLGSGVACASLLYLAAVPVAASPFWRLFGLAGVGLSIGLLNTAVFHALSDAYRHEPAATVNLGGAVFGLGSLVTAVTVAGTFYVYTVPSILILLATLPGFHSGLFLKWPFPTYPQRPSPSFSEALHDFRSLGAVLFALLLFLQFGNEWAVAGWLPVFLTQRLGISPETSLWLLALYWLSLIVGRILAQSILHKISHARLLFGSMLAAIFGCLILSVTNNLFGAVTGILLLGGGFASIYPLVVEKIGHRFPYYHPGFFNGIFSFALVGGLVAPWLLGHMAEFFGVGVVMALPAAGSVLVLVLLLLIWLEARMSEHTPPPGTSAV
jgi:predicted MFS family arabinose efflux permease